MAASLPTLLHHIGKDKWADWVRQREKEAEKSMKGWFSKVDADTLASQTDQAVRDLKPYVMKHASLSGGFAAGFIAGLNT